MRRLLVVLALMLAGSAAISVAGEGPPAVPLNPHDDPTPPAADAVLSTVRSVLSPVAPADPALLPAPAAPAPAPVAVADLVPAEQEAASPAPAPEASAAPQKERASADDARCEPLTVTLSAGPRAVAPGEQSTLLVAVGNPGNRPLSRLSITHQLTGSDGVRFNIVSTNPPADSGVARGSPDGSSSGHGSSPGGSSQSGKVVFDNLGRLGVGATRQVQVVVSVDRSARSGQIVSNAVASGDCESGRAGAVAVSGKAALPEPAVTGRAVAAAAPPAPKPAAAAPAPVAEAAPKVAAAAPAPAGGGLLSRTGGLVGLAVACYLTAAGLGLQLVGGRRRARRRRPARVPVRWMCEKSV